MEYFIGILYMSRNSRTSLERIPSAGSMDSTYIPEELRRSLGTALTLSQNERKRYKRAYAEASKSRKRRHIAKHLRRKTARRAERKRATRRSPIEEEPVPPKKPPVSTRRNPDEYSRRSGVDNMRDAADRRADRVENVRVFIARNKYGIDAKLM